MTSENVQTKLIQTNMFAVTKNINFDFDIGIMNGITPQNISDLKIRNIFSSISEIKKLQ